MNESKEGSLHSAVRQRMLSARADGAGLTEVLVLLVRCIEVDCSPMLACILLVDVSGTRLKTAAAPSLPCPINDKIDGLTIGPEAGPWGLAAFNRQRVVVKDMRTDPLLKDYSELGDDAGLVSCWVEPILGNDGTMLGTFTMYSDHAVEPSDADVASLNGAAGLAAEAIEAMRAEDALRTSNQLLEASQSIAKVGGWELDLVSGRLFWTAETYRIHETTPEEFDPTVDAGVGYFLPDSRQRISDALQGAIERGEGYDLELETLTTKGRRIDVRTTCKVTSQDGRSVKLTGIFQDISEQKSAAAVLQESRQKLANAMSLAKMADWGIDLVRNVFYFNERIYSIFGTSVEREGSFEMPADKFLAEFCHPHDVALLERHMAEAIEAPPVGTQQFEYRLLRRDTGALRHMSLHYQVVLDSVGRGISGFGSVIDITERKGTEIAREKSETQLKAVIDSAMDAIVLLDDKQRILLFNRAAEEMFGHSAADMLGQPLDRIIPAEHRAKHSSSVSNMDHTEGSGRQMGAKRDAIAAQHANGNEFPIEVSISKTFAGGKTLYVAIARDLTLRKADEAERMALREQLLHAQQLDSIGQLAGGVAHDFNNMLNVIQLSAVVALDREPSVDVKEDLGLILDAAQRSASLTRQLLAFSRQEAIVPKVLKLDKMVGDMLTMLRRLLGEHLHVTWLPGPSQWTVKMDPGQVDQLLVNLCVNARDAIGGQGSVVISTEDVRLDHVQFQGDREPISGDFVRLTVKDDGCGMDADTIAKIFEPFFTTKKVGDGTGLGLSTAYGIIKQNGGAVAVTSEVGGGSTFSIYLPRSAQPVASIEQGERNATEAGSGEMVLVVDDEPSMLMACRRVLTTLGYQVLVTSDPHEALKLAKEHADELRLLITDVVMPQVNGPELFALLSPTVSDLRCLFMSGYTADTIATRGVLKDDVAFVQKPFKPHEIGKKIREILDA